MAKYETDRYKQGHRDGEAGAGYKPPHNSFLEVGGFGMTEEKRAERKEYEQGFDKGVQERKK